MVLVRFFALSVLISAGVLYLAEIQKEILTGISWGIVNDKPRNRSLKFALENLSENGEWLSDLNLRGAYLSYSDLNGSVFSRSSFEGSILESSNFEGANLRDAKFNNAILSGVNFSNSFLYGAVFTGAVLDGVNITGANLRGSVGLACKDVILLEGWEEAVLDGSVTPAIQDGLAVCL